MLTGVLFSVVFGRFGSSIVPENSDLMKSCGFGDELVFLFSSTIIISRDDSSEQKMHPRLLFRSILSFLAFLKLN